VVLVVLEAGVLLGEDERAMTESLEGRYALIALNKCDLKIAIEPLPQLSIQTVSTSAITGQGIEDLRHALLALVSNSPGEKESGMLISLRRHKVVTAALDALREATEAIGK
jgi:tRNA modification GTPase